MNNRPVILFLYSEVMGYTLACLENLAIKHNADVHVVFWDREKLTPFNPESSQLSFYPRSSFNHKKLLSIIRDIQPNVIYVSGRMDPLYLKVAKICKRQGLVTVSGMDNQYTGSIRQRVATLCSYYLYRQYFDYIWVPGSSQKKYALKLGYKEDKILDNLYSADYILFKGVQWKFNKRFVFAGRLAEVKNIKLLISAFKNLNCQDWKLTIIGSGPLGKELKSDNPENVEFISFLSPQNLKDNMNEGGIFCLPSIDEPFGVVVHEYAAGGYPMILSDRVGAAEHFLEPGLNGFLFDPGNLNDLENKLQKMVGLSESELLKMSSHSKLLAAKITPDHWSKAIMSIYDPQH